MNQQPARPLVIFEDLPNEMIVAVLRELNLPHLVNCRSVSKRFKNLIDKHLKIQDLLLFDHKYLKNLSEIVLIPSFRHLFEQSKSRILKSPSFKNFFCTSLKSLVVCSPIEEPNVLNHFRSLRRLYIWNIIIAPGARLSLPELRVLYIVTIESCDIPIEATLTINSKVLEELACFDLHRIKLTNFDAVKQLTGTNLVLRSLYLLTPVNLIVFKRLRILVIRITIHDLTIDSYADPILALKNLAELHFQVYVVIREAGRERFDQMVEQIWAKKPALRIFWLGIELTKKDRTKLINRKISDWAEIFKVDTLLTSNLEL